MPSTHNLLIKLEQFGHKFLATSTVILESEPMQPIPRVPTRISKNAWRVPDISLSWQSSAAMVLSALYALIRILKLKSMEKE
jgi:hypothetical protein